MAHKVFVYGSLKKGFGNHHFLRDSKLVAKGHTFKNEFDMFSQGGFPSIHKDGDKHIAGELYEIDDNTLDRLDMLEGNGHLYQREEQDILMQDGGVDRAWIYVFLHPPNGRKDRVHEEGRSLEWRADGNLY